MNNWPWREMIVGATLVLATGAMVAAAWTLLESEPKEPSRANVPVERPQVRAIELRSVAIETAIEESGEVQPSDKPMIESSVSGEVVEQHVEVGEYVEADAAIFSVSDPLLAARRRESQEALEAARLKWVAAYDAYQQVREDGEQVRAEAKAKVEDAKTEYDQAQAKLRQYTEQKDVENIAAPVAGVVAGLAVGTGELVAEGKPVGQLFVLDPARVVVQLSSRETPNIQPGDKTAVLFPYRPDLGETPGEVLKVGDAADPVAKQVEAVIEFANPERSIRAGMPARVRFSSTGPAAVTVPRIAVRLRGGRPLVWKVIPAEKETASTLTPVEVKFEAMPGRDDLLRVVHGLEPGDRIAVHGLLGAAENFPVDVMMEDWDPNAPLEILER